MGDLWQVLQQKRRWANIHLPTHFSKEPFFCSGHMIHFGKCYLSSIESQKVTSIDQTFPNNTTLLNEMQSMKIPDEPIIKAFPYTQDPEVKKMA
ncbi:hypothetical protein [Endozoicomonas ascidiicola]|uniref:hypothetical protein n=1 Tax=Endozoicomonas ascidiicola TaxID=1698521 RepID=UPI00083097A6|nr:hypothetical protein [Endozoicomonas ascidiicola]